MEKRNIEILDLPRERIDEIEPLWNALNSHHQARSTHFEQHFSTFTFDKRVKHLNAAPYLKIFVAVDGDVFVGYCIASANESKGEIDSLYVQQGYQGARLGQQLMDCSIAWLEDQKCTQISVYVAEGNEEAMPFYERFGFKPRFQVMQIRR
ncbi:N-acetyltransferase family protein [Pontibacterium sp.]|uniref:GNAT family N-acetyltransferase n=1 Tax=Pontibacterium sp. TaxID=2036026 RepID=UPI003514DC7F